MDSKARIIYLDILKIAGIISVILIHVSANLFYKYGQIGSDFWWIGNISDSLSRWGVPIFLMSSGALLLNRAKREESLKNFWRKRIKKILVPLIFWTILYYFWDKLISHQDINLQSIKELIKNSIQGGTYYHLHFLYYLLGLYIITPILRRYLTSANKNDLVYFIFLWLISNLLIPILNSKFSIHIGIPFYLTQGYIGYFLLGYFFDNYTIPNYSRKTIYFLGLVGVLITIFGTYFETNNSGYPNETYYDYLSPGVILMSISIFLFFKNNNFKIEEYLRKNNHLNKLVTIFTETIFGIYLIHPIIIDILNYFGVNAFFIYPLVGVPFSLLLIILFSFLFVLIIKKIPLIKSII